MDTLDNKRNEIRPSEWDEKRGPALTVMEPMMLNERPIPEAALHDNDAVEMLRVWIAEKKLHCSIKVGMYRETTNTAEEKAWGMILADITRHISMALEKSYAVDHSTVIREIRAAYLRELGDPTSVAHGEFVPKQP